MNVLQAIVDQANDDAKRVRSTTQMTLGKLIERLAAMSPSAGVPVLKNPHSYRGYYEDLAFETTDGVETVFTTLEILRGCMGREFTGYKGGEYMIGETTPIWVADYGCCGRKIMDLSDESLFELADDE